MNTPIIDPSTLTEEQREAIKNQYAIRKEFVRKGGDLWQIHSYIGIYKTLEWLFGEELFQKGE